MKTMFLLLLPTVFIPIMLCAQITDWVQMGIDARDPKKQIEYFTKSVEQGNDLFAAYFCRASVYLSQGEVQRAIDDYSKCIEIDSNDASAYYNRGMAKSSVAEDYQGANADFDKARKFSPLEINSNSIINGFDRQTTDRPCLVMANGKVLKEFPDYASAYGYLGYFYLAMSNDSLALENFSNSIALHPDKTDAYLGLALLYYYKNDLVSAKKYFDQARALNPKLQQGIAGFAMYKDDGFICNDRDNEALKIMFSKWK